MGRKQPLGHKPTEKRESKEKRREILGEMKKDIWAKGRGKRWGDRWRGTWPAMSYFYLTLWGCLMWSVSDRGMYCVKPQKTRGAWLMSPGWWPWRMTHSFLKCTPEVSSKNTPAALSPPSRQALTRQQRNGAHLHRNNTWGWRTVTTGGDAAMENSYASTCTCTTCNKLETLDVLNRRAVFPILEIWNALSDGQTISVRSPLAPSSLWNGNYLTKRGKMKR